MLLMIDIYFKNFNCVCKNGKEGYKVFIEIIEDFYFKNLVKWLRLLFFKKKIYWLIVINVLLKFLYMYIYRYIYSDDIE